ncbi:MFS transporter [Burkholderia ubonensis]|nr:MFS transporter [Burkholderia ubonensis]
MSTSNNKTPAMAALAAWIGSAMEYYDFFIYGTAAALVFGKVFFPGSSPSMGLLLALATFGVGYVARPVAAFFLGHIGDKFGRKRVLVLTLVLMGVSTFLVGCLPTYDHVGMLAPALLVVLRLCQGFSASGEQAGANSMSLEHAPSNRRAFFTSFTLSGTQAGLILAMAVFLPISRLPEEQLLSWGWRVPFWLSAVVVLIGYLIRRNLNETPVFEEEQRTRHVARMPLAVLFKHYSADVLRVVLCALVSTVSTIFGVFALSYAVNVVKIDRGTMLWVAILTNIVALVAIPLFAMLADRIGRKPVYLFGIVGPAILMFPYLWPIEQQNIPLIFVFGILMSGVAYSASNGIWPSFFAEMFDTRVRLSGMAIGTQIGFALAGFAPTVAAALLKTGPGAWMPVAWFVAGACALAALSTLTARETYDVEMEELGRKEGSVVGGSARV